ncbi:hypothetical protein HZS_652, partial [Henneguya salminicola]
MNLSQFVAVFERIYPKTLAESWDKVGLIICPDWHVKIHKILIANDLTMSVVQLAKSKNIDLIICYHPLIFSSLSTISVHGTWQEKVAIECVKSNISVYSFHTIVDNMMHGLNDFVANKFSHCSIKPIQKMECEKFSRCFEVGKKELLKGIVDVLEKSN